MLMESGEFFTGANIENASYPVGTCAERVALGNAVVCAVTTFYFKVGRISRGSYLFEI